MLAVPLLAKHLPSAYPASGSVTSSQAVPMGQHVPRIGPPDPPASRGGPEHWLAPESLQSESFVQGWPSAGRIVHAAMLGGGAALEHTRKSLQTVPSAAVA
jgi:hypothetical protein